MHWNPPSTPPPQRICYIAQSLNAEGISVKTPRALDLFSGQGSWRDAFLLMGYDVVTMDKSPRFHPQICCDILKWKYWEDFKPGDFEVISASVPCEHYSTARSTSPRNLPRANRIVRKTLEIIAYLKPKKWLIENPRYGLLRDQPFMKNLDFVDVDYCQFSDYGYKKPTRIWGGPEIKNIPPSFAIRKPVEIVSMEEIYVGGIVYGWADMVTNPPQL